MKELTAFALGLLILFSLSMPASAAPEIPQMVRDLGFEVVQSDDTHRPVYIAGSSRLYATSTTDVEMLFAGELAQLYQLGPEDRIEVSRQSQIGGKIFYRLSQTYRGLPVIGTQLVVQTSARGRVEAILGRVCPRLEVQTERYLPFDRVIETGVADFPERHRSRTRGLAVSNAMSSLLPALLIGSDRHLGSADKKTGIRLGRDPGRGSRLAATSSSIEAIPPLPSSTIFSRPRRCPARAHSRNVSRRAGPARLEGYLQGGGPEVPAMCVGGKPPRHGRRCPEGERTTSDLAGRRSMGWREGP